MIKIDFEKFMGFINFSSTDKDENYYDLARVEECTFRDPINFYKDIWKNLDALSIIQVDENLDELCFVKMVVLS